MRSMHAGFYLIPLHFRQVVVYHRISAFFLILDPSLKTARAVVPGLVFITSYGVTLILCPLNVEKLFFFFCQCVVCLSFISSLSLLFHRLETLTGDHYFTLP